MRTETQIRNEIITYTAEKMENLGISGLIFKKMILTVFPNHLSEEELEVILAEEILEIKKSKLNT